MCTEKRKKIVYRAATYILVDYEKKLGHKRERRKNRKRGILLRMSDNSGHRILAMTFFLFFLLVLLSQLADS